MSAIAFWYFVKFTFYIRYKAFNFGLFWRILRNYSAV